MKVGVMALTSNTWKYDESTIVLGFFVLSNE